MSVGINKDVRKRLPSKAGGSGTLIAPPHRTIGSDGESWKYACLPFTHSPSQGSTLVDLLHWAQETGTRRSIPNHLQWKTN